MLIKRSKLSNLQTNRLMIYFAAGRSAREAGDRASVNRNTARDAYHRFRVSLSNNWSSRRYIQRFDDWTKEAQHPYRDNTTSIAKIRVEKGSVCLRPSWQIDNGAFSEPEASSTFHASIFLRSNPRRNQIIGAADLHFRERYTKATHTVSTQNILKEYSEHVLQSLSTYKGVRYDHLWLFLCECHWRYSFSTTRDRVYSLYLCLRDQRRTDKMTWIRALTTKFLD